MSSNLHIEPTQFTNVRNGNVTYGFRLYDDYVTAYDNTWDSIPDDDLDVLETVLQEHDHGDEVNIALDSVREQQNGLYIGNEWYSWDQVKNIFKEYE